MGHVQIRSLVFLLCFHLIEPRWHRPYKERLTEGKVIPKDLDPRQRAQLQLPNNIFCAQMEREATGIFSLLPWWYHYCQDLKERNAKKMKNFYKPMYQSVLANLKWLRRMGLTPPPRVMTKRYFRRL